MPALTYGLVPDIDLSEWRLKVSGLVERPLHLSWQEFEELPKTNLITDFHCVTLWSRLDNEWWGTLAGELLELARPLQQARYVLVHSYGGFQTNLSLETMLGSDVILAQRHDSRELSPEHGWPLRLVVPSRYGWKSAKWVREIQVLDEDVPGFWERRGFHSNADPWLEQRFWDNIPNDFGITLALCNDKL